MRTILYFGFLIYLFLYLQKFWEVSKKMRTYRCWEVCTIFLVKALLLFPRPVCLFLFSFVQTSDQLCCHNSWASHWFLRRNALLIIVLSLLCGYFLSCLSADPDAGSCTSDLKREDVKHLSVTALLHIFLCLISPVFWSLINSLLQLILC